MPPLWMHRLTAILGLLCLLPPALAAQEPPQRLKGLHFSHLDRANNDLLSPAATASLRYLKRDVHANWIALTPSGYQSAHDAPAIYLQRDDPPDAHLYRAIAQAQALGLKVMLKPHIQLPPGRHWRGDIRMANEDAWERWFAAYGAFIDHYAGIAAAAGVDLLCIGTELSAAATQRPDDWRRLIARVRTLYPGPLVYAANWTDEYDQIIFWDALDYIGVNAYFPLSKTPYPDAAELRTNAAAVARQIALVHRQSGKPVLLTEVGFKSAYGTSMRPWAWHRGRGEAVDLRTQALCYEAVFAAFWPEPWFAGMFWWRWYSDLRRGGVSDSGFTPQHKPAEAVLKRWYKRH